MGAAPSRPPLNSSLKSFPGSAVARRRRRRGFDPWVGKIPWSRKWQRAAVTRLENSMGRGAWQATVHGGRRESHGTERLSTHRVPSSSHRRGWGWRWGVRSWPFCSWAGHIRGRGTGAVSGPGTQHRPWWVESRVVSDRLSEPAVKAASPDPSSDTHIGVLSGKPVSRG